MFISEFNLLVFHTDAMKSAVIVITVFVSEAVVIVHKLCFHS